MMQPKLKKLEMIGFKSFADRIVLDFSYGVTAIVGPNGCGKSNITDAIRWVLGEQSARSMRGAKMDDLIFSGTSKRKPLNLAEVTITFSNEDGSFPIAYEEISITRRVHRSGESEYLINRHSARLKDIHYLLMGSGIGRNAFANFEQGKIDQVIHLSPAERRFIIEEVAGISRFLSEKSEAFRKLQNTEHNLERVLDIHEEVGKQVVLYEKQALQAKEYKEKKAELEQLEIEIFVAKWEQHHRLWLKFTDIEIAHQEKHKSVSLAFEHWQTELQTAKQNLEQNEGAYREKNQTLHQVLSSKEVKVSEIKSYADRLLEQVLRENQLKEEKGRIRENRENLKEAIEKSNKEIVHLEKEIAEAQEMVCKHRDHTHSLEQETSKLREEQMKAQQEWLRSIQEENSAESRLNQMKMRLEHLLERKEKTNERKKKYVETILLKEVILKEKKECLSQFHKDFEGRQQELKSLVSSIKGLHQQVAQLKEALEQQQKELTDAKARSKALEQLRTEQEGFSEATKHLLKESPFSEILQPLYELFSIQKEDQAIAVSLRSYGQTLVVKNQKELPHILGYAKEKKLKDFSLVCLSDIGTTHAEIHSHFSSKLQIVNHIEDSLQRKEVEIWSREDGLYIDANHVIFCPGFSETNAFMREAEFNQLQIHISEKAKEVKELEGRIKEQVLQRDETQKTHQTKEKSLRQDEMKLVEIQYSLQKEQGELEKATLEMKDIETEQIELQREIREVAQAVEETEKVYQTVKHNSEVSKKAHNTLEMECGKHVDILKNQQKHQRTHEGSYRELLNELQKKSYHLNLSKIREEENLKQEERIDSELEKCLEMQKNIKSLEQDCEREIAKTSSELEIIQNEVQKVHTLCLKQKEAVSSLENQGDELREAVKAIEQEMYDIRTKKEQNQSLKEGIEKEVQERNHLSIQQLIESGVSRHENFEAAEKRARSLRRQLEGMGDVNLTAIEEWKNHKERHEFITHQLEDLRQAKEQLAEIIRNLDTESRKMFEETFEKVREYFRKNFSLLFSGGEADLKLTDNSTDVLEAGIEIVAKPPGKQMRSISLLSGGEKCLTALALLFAIFEVKPAPFSILDEIDAPLDDSNVDRFTGVVQQFIHRSQFIIVTHNKRTMAIADRIYGVSMEEKGVSKMLSMEFQREEIVAPV